MKDLNRAFPRTPDAVEEAIRAGVRRGRRRALLRARLRRAVAAAAVLAVAAGVFSLAVHRGAPGGRSPQPLRGALASQSVAPARSATPSPEATLTAAPRPTGLESPVPATPEATGDAAPRATKAQAVTPEPTALPPETEGAALRPAKVQTESAALTPRPTRESEHYAAAQTNRFSGEAALQEYLEASLPDEQFYFCTDGGRYFHADRTCSNMRGAQGCTLRAALEMGKDFCPVCIGAYFACSADALAWRSERDGNYHADRACAGVGETPADIERALTTVERARILGLTPCPDCITRRMIVPAVTDSALYCTAGGQYVHSVSNCSKMRDALPCTLSQALAVGKHLCPVCIGSACAYVNAVVWNRETGQLLISLETSIDGEVGVTAGSRLDLTAMEHVERPLSARDEATLTEAMAGDAYAGAMEAVGAVRVDVLDLEVTLEGRTAAARSAWTEGNCQRVCLLYDDVSESALDALQFGIEVVARDYCVCDAGLFVRETPAMATILAVGYELNYCFNDEGEGVGFAPGALLYENAWTEQPTGGARSVLLRDGGEARIDAYALETPFVAGEGAVVLTARVGAGVDLGIPEADAYRVAMEERTDGSERTYTAILTEELAEAILRDPTLLGLELALEGTAAAEETARPAETESVGRPPQPTAVPEASAAPGREAGGEA